MDNSIFSSFQGNHNMITRYKKKVVNKDRTNSVSTETSDDDYNPNNDKCSSNNTSSSSLDILDELIDESEIKMLISDAKDIILNIDDNNENEDTDLFTGYEILNTESNFSIVINNSEDNLEIDKIDNKDKIKENDIDKDYLKFLKKNKTESDTQVSYKYFKNLEDTKKKSILTIEKNIREINQGVIPIRFKILNLPVDVSVKAQIMRRFNSLEQMEESNSDYHKINEWLSTLLNVPFNKYYNLSINKNNSHTEIQKYLVNIKNVLDDSIYGHDEAKFQIVQLITQWITNPKSKGKIIGLQGPMGNGKTTLVKEGVCKEIDRPFATIPLGGASDASLLEGHSYTYEGSVCGQIVKILIESKCMNPVIYFDELDKVSDCPKGLELINKLVHLTDHSQNHEFTDIYFSGIKFDLSRALFIFSFNDETKINPILRDRIHIIKMKGLNSNDKQIISKNYLIPSLCQEIGFNREDIIIDNNIIEYIITNYTKEEGVRSLKRCIDNIISKINILKYIKNDDKINIPFMIEDIKFPLNITQDIVDRLLIKDKEKTNFMMYT